MVFNIDVNFPQATRLKSFPINSLLKADIADEASAFRKKVKNAGQDFYFSNRPSYPA